MLIVEMGGGNPEVAKQVFWIGSAREDLRAFPEAVQDEVGHALWLAQCGEKPRQAKPLQGFNEAGVLEIVENHDGDTYRAVYTVRFENALYILHCFQKKSRHGIKTDPRDMELMRQRLRAAEEHHRASRSGER